MAACSHRLIFSGLNLGRLRVRDSGRVAVRVGVTSRVGAGVSVRVHRSWWGMGLDLG